MNRSAAYCAQAVDPDLRSCGASIFLRSFQRRVLMKYRQLWLVAIVMAIVGLAGATSALAVAVNPFSPTLSDIQTLQDQTSGFSSGAQLSTIDAFHVAPDGLHLDVT